MNNQTINYLVPVDFTPASIGATQFALDMAPNENSKIILLHVISSEKDRGEAEKSMVQFVKENSTKNTIVDTKILQGSLTSVIEVVVKTMNIDLVFLGTHCITGLGKVFKSHAFKIVDNISVPLIIVQKETKFSAIKKIALTIDLDRESVQVVKMAAKISQLFNSEIILVAKEQNDSSLKTRTEINMAICHRVLEEKNIKHQFIYIEENDFIGGIFKLCQEQNIDLLAATFYQKHVHVFTESFIQQLAYNDFHIPLLTIDEESTTKGKQFGAMWA